MQTINEAIINNSKHLSINRMCKALEITRSFYYKNKNRFQKKEKNELLKEEIKEIKSTYPYYGYRRVKKQLERLNYKINHKKVLSIMNKNNLLCVKKKKKIKTTNSDPKNKVYSNIASKIELNNINQLWVSDITYIPFGSGFVYLSIVLDAFSRKCIGFALSPSLENEIVFRAINMALSTRNIKNNALIHHSDRGSQYTSKEYLNLLEKKGIRISMSRKGNPYDNAICERFMGIFKEECLSYNEYNTARELYNIVFYYIHNVYNKKRLHSSLGYVSPEEYEQILDFKSKF